MPPSSFSTLRRSFRLARKGNNKEEAVRGLTEVIDKGAKDPRLFIRRGVLTGAKEDFERGETASAGSNRAVYYFSSLTAFRRGDFDETIAIVKRAQAKGVKNLSLDALHTLSIFSKDGSGKAAKLLFVFTALIISCGKVQKPDEQDEKPEQEDGTARKEMLAHIVPLEDAIQMYNGYSLKRIDPLKSSLRKKYGERFNDTRIITIDLETMKQYISYIEEKSKDLDVTPEGLQFYFGVYPNSEDMKDSIKNHQTFFIAPSTSNNNVQSGYTLESIGEKVQIVYLKDKLKNSSDKALQNQKVEKASFFTTTTIVQEDGLLLNRGVPNPPGDSN